MKIHPIFSKHWTRCWGTSALTGRSTQQIYHMTAFVDNQFWLHCHANICLCTCLSEADIPNGTCYNYCCLIFYTRIVFFDIHLIYSLGDMFTFTVIKNWIYLISLCYEWGYIKHSLLNTNIHISICFYVITTVAGKDQQGVQDISTLD